MLAYPPKQGDDIDAAAVDRLTHAAQAAGTADEVHIEIDDDGPGIPTADRERVFDRFVRLDNSRDRSTGTSGLGHAIAREIARAHRGHIAIEDSSTGGTRMIITLLPATSSTQPPQHSIQPGGADAG